MRFKYRIKVYNIVQKFEGEYNAVKQYMPQRMENTFMGRIYGWYNLTEYPRYTEDGARNEVEKDKLYWNVRSRNSRSEYINID